ncbi:Cell division cycle-related protein res2/pct1 [Daldinia childiae]|uniref:Cell division cycle-related protein res2/pct1 n=1 Tax=Daldinia childiae TaxID=326645 RepID=UPI0014479D6B|nr:Cell division cycle-related protein res2/pct1 [Daldinia childiae]KAF3057977.1 Cell division cycle-related protein res2/pct1 [Daldinia childiae]
MVKDAPNAVIGAGAGTVAAAGIYSATYSGVPVYEFQFGGDNKEHVMRRRQDDWVNATHILKAAGFDKPARTRILEREVQKDVHEKIQGGYGKYQGTWIPLEAGEQLAQRNNIFERLRPIFEFVPGNQSPPPAPRHASKPKAPRKPAVPKWGAPPPQELETASQQLNEDDTPDNVTRKREDNIQDLTEQQHSVYGDELLDYFLLSRNEAPNFRPEPPPNFQPDWPIDTEKHTALHWASAMGDVDVIKQLKRFGATLGVQNCKGETPFMRSVNFTNCYEKQTFPQVMKELWDTVDARDDSGCTVIHHAAIMKSGRITSTSCCRYYLDNILNKLQETHDPNFVQHIIDTQDHGGNTALHLAAKTNARKCIRALLGRGASTDIPNAEGIRAEDLIKELNATKNPKERVPQRSSSPFAPDSQRHVSLRDAITESVSKLAVTYNSEAANTVQNKITPLVLEKFQDLAHSYDEEWKEKNEAEMEARRILANTQNELAVVRAQIAELDSQLESPEAASKVVGEATILQQQVTSLLASQSRYYVHSSVEQAVSMMNGDTGDNSYEERVQLAQELRELVVEQRRAEKEYVDALGVSGTGEKIDKYRRLLKECLDQEAAENLDSNLDDLIDMMEEERSEGAPAIPGQGEPMMIC